MSRSPTTPKFKIQMCQLYLSGKCTYAGLAETYNISKRTLREWVLKYNANCKCKLDTCTVELSKSERRSGWKPQASVLGDAAAAFGCVNRVEELVKQFFRGSAAQLLARASVQLVSGR